MAAGGGAEETCTWVPVTIHLPMGIAKGWHPGACGPATFMCGPYMIILLAQLGQTVLVPVREMGYSRSAYGVLQSATPRYVARVQPGSGGL